MQKGTPHIQPPSPQTKKICKTHIIQKGLCKILYIQNLVQKGVAHIQPPSPQTKKICKTRYVQNLLLKKLILTSYEKCVD